MDDDKKTYTEDEERRRHSHRREERDEDYCGRREYGRPDIPVEAIGELLDKVSDKLPKLLEGVHRAYYSIESGTNAGKSVGAFYKELIASGIPQDVALNLTEKYMISLSDFQEMWPEKDK